MDRGLVGGLLTEIHDIADLKARLGQAPISRLGPNHLDSRDAQVIADKGTGGIGTGEEVDRVTRAAADVG